MQIRLSAVCNGRAEYHSQLRPVDVQVAAAHHGPSRIMSTMSRSRSSRPRSDGTDRLITNHDRHWRQFEYVYPVISRRSRGLSVGINLNIDTACNFDCVYCQVDRTQPPPRRDVDLDQVRHELDTMIKLVTSGQIWSDERFAETPVALRRFNDIAFSGDGEPTACPAFAEAVRMAAALKYRHRLTTTRLVLITNATLLDRPGVRDALTVLDANDGEVWAKLDAGTESYFKRVDRPGKGIHLALVLDNIAAVGRHRPIVIQTMWIDFDKPTHDPAAEFESYLDRLSELVDAGCRIREVQLYTVARRPAEPDVRAVEPTQLEALADRVRQRLPGVECRAYPAATA